LHRLAALSLEVRICPGHTSSPIAFDERPITATLGEVTERVHALRLAEAEFVETILSRLPPTPPNHGTIVALNKSGNLPVGDVTDLEAGANRCAVS
jgi:hypothetical protein